MTDVGGVGTWAAIAVSGATTVLVTIIGARRGAKATLAASVDAHLKLLIEQLQTSNDALRKEVKELKARIEVLENQLYGRSGPAHP